MKKNYIIFDLEATCEDRNIVQNYKNEIIEIGAVKLNSEGEIIDQFSRFCKPDGAVITKFCTELTSITQKDIDKADPLVDVLIEFNNWAKDSYLISWGGYDMNQLERDINRNEIDHVIDTADMRSRHRNFKQIYADNKRLPRGVGITKALNMERIKFEGTHHRGIDDAKNIAKLFQHTFTKFSRYAVTR